MIPKDAYRFSDKIVPKNETQTDPNTLNRQGP